MQTFETEAQYLMALYRRDCKQSKDAPSMVGFRVWCQTDYTPFEIDGFINVLDSLSA